MTIFLMTNGPAYKGRAVLVLALLCAFQSLLEVD